MKTKILSSFLLVLLFALTLVCAQDFTTSVSSVTFKSGTPTISFTLAPNASTYTNFSFTMASILNDDGVNIAPSAPITLSNVNTSQTISLSASPDYNTLSFGKAYSGNLLIADVQDSTNTRTVAVNFERSFCSNGERNASNLNLDIDYEVIEGLGEDEDWYPLDQVEVTVNIENTYSDDLEDLVLEWCLYDVDAKECVLEDEEDSVDVDEDDDQDVVFTIELDPSDLNSGNSDYILYYKVYGDNSDFDEESLCTEEAVSSINIVIPDHFVALGNVEIPETATCGGLVDITGKAWNIGDSDEDDTYIIVYNKELGLNNQRIDLGDIDSFDDKSFNLEFTIPQNASDKSNTIEFRVYDEDDDLFEDDDAEARYTYTIKTENCKAQTASASITAELSSDTPRAIVGSQVAIEATIKNTGSVSASYVVDVTGNSQWSSVAEIDPKSFSLNAGESKKVVIYLDLNKDASVGDKEFSIRATSGLAVVEQKLALSLEKGFSTSAIVTNFQKNWFIYTIVLVNLILIIAIILVVRRILSK